MPSINYSFGPAEAGWSNHEATVYSYSAMETDIFGDATNVTLGGVAGANTGIYSYNDTRTNSDFHSLPESVWESMLYNTAAGYIGFSLGNLTQFIGDTYTITIFGCSFSATERVMDYAVNGGTAQTYTSVITGSAPNAPVVLTGTISGDTLDVTSTFVTGMAIIGGFTVDISSGASYTVSTEADVTPGETITLTHNLGTLTGAKLIAGTSEQALSLTGNNATAPALSDGLAMVPFGTVTLEATNGTDTATTSIDYAGNASIGVTTLAAGFTTGAGTASENFTGDPQVVGDQYAYPSANNFSITDQNIPQADSSQTVTVYSLDVSDTQILAEAFNVSYTEATADTTPDAYSYTSTTGNALSSTSTSNVITVAGVDAATNIPLTLTGAGTYEISTDSGATWGTPGTAATNVQLGHQVRLTHTNSAGYSTPTSTSTSIGGTSGTFTTLTIPDPAAVTGDGLVKTMQAVSFKTETLTATNIKAKTL